MEADEISQKIDALPPLERENATARLERYKKGNATKRDEEALRELGIIGQRDDSNDNPDLLGLVDSQEALASCLARHFDGRLTIDISPPRISQWKKGKLLAAGVPLPPAKVGQRLDSKAWAEWIEKYILPKHGAGSELSAHGKDLFRLADEAEAKEKIDRSKITKIERRVAEGQYQSVDVYLRGLRDVGAIVNQKLNAMESLIPDQLASALPPEHKPALLDAIRDACRAAIDASRNDLASALREAGRAIPKTG